MPKINSRSKGKRGEYQVRDLFIDHGFPSRRGQQFSGSPDSPDVVVPDLAQYHIEVKLVEKLDIHKAVAQAIRDGGEAKTPVVFHKKNHNPWLVTMTTEDFFELIIKLHDNEQKQKGKVCHCTDGDAAGGKLGPSNPENLG